MARLPQVGADENQWGDILNAFLRVQHKQDGTHDLAAIGLDKVDNTSDTAKPISAAMQAALDTKATIDDTVALAIALS
jgi:hypothetical protein